MQDLGPATILRIWEHAADARPEQRGSAILAAARDLPLATIEAEALGRRDARLLSLRRDLLGDRVDARGACSSCGAEIEAGFAVADLLADPAPDPQIRTVRAGGLTVEVRALSAGTLAQLTHACRGHDPTEIQREILSHCVVSCETDQGVPTPLPEALHLEIGDAVAALDPLSVISLSLQCPECQTTFETVFDPVAFLWQEISVLVKRLLAEVDQLARAYGWTEAEILALPAARRRAYLRLTAG